MSLLEGEKNIIDQLRTEEKEGKLLQGSPVHTQQEDLIDEQGIKQHDSYEDVDSTLNFASFSEQNNHDSTDLTNTIFQSTSNLMLFLDRTGKIIEINQAGIDFSGFTKEEIIGKRFWKIPGVFSKENVLDYLRVFKNSLLGETTEHFVATLKEKTGKTHTMDFSTYPIYENNCINYILIVAKDITELKTSESKYRLITDNTSDLIAITTFSLNPVYTYVSPSTERIMGYKPDELIGRSSLSFIHPADKGRLLRLIGKYVKWKGKKLIGSESESISETFDYRLKDKQGNWHYLESTADLLDDELLIVSKDITNKKNVETELKESELQYRTIFNASNDIYLVFDFDGNIVDANDAALRTYGYEKEEFLSLSGKDIVHPDYHHIFHKFVSDVKEQGEFNAESIDIKKDGTLFPVEVKGTDFRLQGKQHLLAIVRDTTNKERRKNELRYLADIANSFVTVEDEEIYDLLGCSINQLAGKSIVTVNTIYQSSIHIEKIVGLGDKTIKMVNMLLRKQDLSTPFEGITEEAEEAFRSGKLTKIEGGLYESFFERVPQPICALSP